MKGFTLIELVLTIAVLALIAVAILLPLSSSLQNSPTASAQEVAIALAGQRMDLIVGRKPTQFFASYTDPCPGPALCTVASGYTVASSIVTNWQSNTNYQEITITVSGTGDAVVKTLVANYR